MPTLEWRSCLRCGLQAGYDSIGIGSGSCGTPLVRVGVGLTSLEINSARRNFNTSAGCIEFGGGEIWRHIYNIEALQGLGLASLRFWVDVATGAPINNQLHV